MRHIDIVRVAKGPSQERVGWFVATPLGQRMAEHLCSSDGTRIYYSEPHDDEQCPFWRPPDSLFAQSGRDA